MQTYFELLSQTRKNFIELIDGLSIEQINKIPPGFNNNIIWNFAHIISAQQILCYRMAGITPVVDESFLELFKKGTKPESFLDEEKLNYIKKLAIATIEKLEIDYNDHVFANYKSYTTSYNFTLNGIDDAIRFVSVHEGLHLGYAMALRKQVSI